MLDFWIYFSGFNNIFLCLEKNQKKKKTALEIWQKIRFLFRFFIIFFLLLK